MEKEKGEWLKLEIPLLEAIGADLLPNIIISGIIHGFKEFAEVAVGIFQFPLIRWDVSFLSFVLIIFILNLKISTFNACGSISK